MLVVKQCKQNNTRTARDYKEDARWSSKIDEAHSVHKRCSNAISSSEIESYKSTKQIAQKLAKKRKIEQCTSKKKPREDKEPHRLPRLDTLNQKKKQDMESS